MWDALFAILCVGLAFSTMFLLGPLHDWIMTWKRTKPFQGIPRHRAAEDQPDWADYAARLHPPVDDD